MLWLDGEITLDLVLRHSIENGSITFYRQATEFLLNKIILLYN